MRKEKAKLKADFALVCDTELFAPDLPTLCVGLRGIVYTEIEAVGAKTTCTPACTAAPRRIRFSARSKSSQAERREGQILIPGFYNKSKHPAKRN